MVRKINGDKWRSLESVKLEKNVRLVCAASVSTRQCTRGGGNVIVLPWSPGNREAE